MQIRDDRLLLSPSDVNNYLACEHRTTLDLRRLRGEIKLEKAPRPDAELVAERGRRHEAEFLAGLRNAGREVVEIDVDAGRLAAVAATEQAMRDGAEIVYQAAFLDPEAWVGYADFLLRTDEPSDLGDFSYEAYDTKLSKHPKPYFILQLAFYTEQIARVQGRMPERMHVVLGTNETHSYRYADFSAYVRRVRQRFLDYLGDGVANPPYPYPVEHCDYCDWWARCRDKRRADDHLSLVAMLGRSQAVKLEDAEVRTVASLAKLPAHVRVPRLNRGTLDGLRQQARLQVYTRTTGDHVREFLPLEEGRGFFRLPAPSPGDVFFDIEGDPYWGDDGLEYLFGSVTLDEVGSQVYRADWAHSREEERALFETWVEWVTERLAEYPDLHIYHYNHYEPTALKRLMSRFGTREDEVDELLRREVFVDLYAVVRQSMRVGEESYSLKAMEVFYPLERDKEVTEAGGSILAYEEWIESHDPAKLQAIADYNADDCRSTLGLREWLLDQRSEAEREFDTVLPNRDAKPPRELKPETAERVTALEQLKADLCAGLPDDPDAELDDDGRLQRLVADLLEYHRREEKPAWWAHFDRLAKTPEELRDEDAEAIGELTEAAEIPRREIRQSWLIPLRFPPQEHKIKPGQNMDANEAGVVVEEIDDARGIVWIARGKRAADRPLPRAILPPRPFGAYEQRDALMRLARRVLARGWSPTGELDAGCDLLAAGPPRIAGVAPGEALQGERVELERLFDQVDALKDSALFIQGPPGSGKTWTGGRMIVELLRRGRRVGVAATSHKAIHKMLDEVEEVAAERGVSFRGLKKATGDHPDSFYESAHIESTAKPEDVAPAAAEIQLIAGTAWLFARPDMTRRLDVLFIDEAGQVALADALAMSQTARSVVLLGDPQQLAHVSQGTHPRGSGASVLEHLLGDRPTVPPDRGVFLDRTWRMHPGVCRFVSNTMYEGRLTSRPGLERWRVQSGGLSGAGVRWLPVDHIGNRRTAVEEAERIAAEVALLLDGGRVTEPSGEDRALALEDILVVAPYNAQVRALVAGLPDGARVGTVDKFQGQEAPVVFFSMTSSSGEDVPRGMDFLFSRNRLNVAVSRAQALAVVVCTPQLLSTRCNSVEQMRLVNALCAFAEEAAAQS